MESLRRPWIYVDATGEQEKMAREIRAERDRRYPNIYAAAQTDERWVGDLGEIIFDAWAAQRRPGLFRWIRDDAAGKPDFVTTNGLRVGLKTVKRKVAPQPGYTAQITARHADEPTDDYFFMSYEFGKRRMWLLGGIRQKRFLERARYYGPGERVHANYEIRAGHEIYNISISELVSAEEWLAGLS
jgi:hypothetical protein